MMRILLPLTSLVLIAWSACTPPAPVADVTIAPDTSEPLPDRQEPLTLATWNLDNFSVKGEHEPRLQAIANEIIALDADLIAVQELKVPVPSDGSVEDAFSSLDALLPDHTAIHGAWNALDTTVGILFRGSRLELIHSKQIFKNDWFAFPRPPLQATFRSQPSGEEFTVIVLHLKAFQEGEERRRDACIKLDAYIRAQAEQEHVVLGDFNDDPFDDLSTNVFEGSFLTPDGFYDFTGKDLPPTSVTSTGWYHYVGDDNIKGEFIDHVLLTHGMGEAWDREKPVIHGVPEAEFEAWIDYSSDHFPVSLTLLPRD